MKYKVLTYSSQLKINTVASLTDFTIVFYKKMDKILDEAYIQHIVKNDYELTFKGVFFRFIWNGFNRFNGITKGIIKISEEKGKLFIDYKLFFNEIFYLCLIFSVVPFLGFFEYFLFRIIAVAMIWAVYIGNNILAANRMKSLFEIIEKEINELPEYKKEIEFQKSLKNAPAVSK